MSIPIYTYDAVIVGAGLAGCAAARELQKAGKKVAVVTKLHPLRSHSGAASYQAYENIRKKLIGLVKMGE